MKKMKITSMKYDWLKVLIGNVMAYTHGIYHIIDR